VYIYYIYKIYTCTCVYIHTYIKEKKWEFCLRCGQVAADQQNLKPSFKFQPFVQQTSPGGEGCLAFPSLCGFGSGFLTSRAPQNRDLA